MCLTSSALAPPTVTAATAKCAWLVYMVGTVIGARAASTSTEDQGAFDGTLASAVLHLLTLYEPWAIQVPCHRARHGQHAPWVLIPRYVYVCTRATGAWWGCQARSGVPTLLSAASQGLRRRDRPAVNQGASVRQGHV